MSLLVLQTMNKLRYRHYLSMTKVEEGVIDVPIVPYEVDSGIYLIKIRGRVRKVGQFGSGEAGAYARFNKYRSTGRRIGDLIESNTGNFSGSYLTMVKLNEVLEVGESAEVYMCEVPGLVYIDGWPRVVSTLIVEKMEKERFSKVNRLWLK